MHGERLDYRLKRTDYCSNGPEMVRRLLEYPLKRTELCLNIVEEVLLTTRISPKTNTSQPKSCKFRQE